MTADTAVNGLPPEARIAGLRSRLVGRLTGLSPYQVRYWHESGLLGASRRVGRRGVPRLYSWVDYLRLRVSASLVAAGVPTHRIRRAVDFLDEQLPGWYAIPLEGGERGHVLVRPEGRGAPLLADAAGQYVLDFGRGELPEETAVPLSDAVGDLRRGGPLGALRRFGEAVTMDPALNLAQPTVRGSTLETQFVAGLARDLGAETVAEIYGLPLERVRQATAFEEAVA